MSNINMTGVYPYRETKSIVEDLTSGDSTHSDNSEDMEDSMNSNDSIFSSSSDTSSISNADLGKILGKIFANVKCVHSKNNTEYFDTIIQSVL